MTWVTIFENSASGTKEQYRDCYAMSHAAALANQSMQSAVGFYLFYGPREIPSKNAIAIVQRIQMYVESLNRRKKKVPASDFDVIFTLES